MMLLTVDFHWLFSGSVTYYDVTVDFHWLFSGLLTEVSRVSEVILNHFSAAQNPFDKVGVIKRN